MKRNTKYLLHSFGSVFRGRNKNQSSCICTKTTYGIVALLLLAGSVHAQPDLTIKRIVDNWPTIDVYVSSSCNGVTVPYGILNTSHFSVKENGFPVQNFTFSCPDTNGCAKSVSLVLDASGSMQGAGNAGAKAGAKAFVNLMDSSIGDEAAVIWFTSAVNVRLGMTDDKQDLLTAIESLPASGATAVWDGGYYGLQEIISSANNSCRAMILLTDGGDNSSTRTPVNIIDLANEHKIRVFTIGLGGVAPWELQQIAVQTGGEYFHAPGASQLVAIFETIFQMMDKHYYECQISYQARCADGSERNVSVMLDYCGGKDTQARSYTAPLDTSGWMPLNIEIGNSYAVMGYDIRIPLKLGPATPPMTKLGLCRFQIRYDESVLEFKSIKTQGHLLDTVAVNAASISSGLMEFSTDKELFVPGGGVLAELIFSTKDVPMDTRVDISSPEWVFNTSCLRAIVNPNRVTVYKSITITPSGSIKLCVGDTITLEAPEGYDSYRWSTNEVTRTIRISSSGIYNVVAQMTGGHPITSEVVVVTAVPAPIPEFVQQSPVKLCRGQSVTLKTTKFYSSYQWSTGESTDSIVVTDAGSYYCTVSSLLGCTRTSPVIEVIVADPPTATISGPVEACPGLVSTFSTDDDSSYTYAWVIGSGGTVMSGQNTSTITVLWNISGKHDVNVSVGRAGFSGCVTTETLSINITSRPHINVDILSSQPFCKGDTAWLRAAGGYSSYLWSTSDTSQVLAVTQPGSYYVRVDPGTACTGYSDTLVIQFSELPEPIILGDTIVCPREVFTYSASGDPQGKYAWEVSNGTILSGGQSENVNIQWDNSSTAILRLTETVGTCSGSTELLITVFDFPEPVIQASGPLILCPGETVDLDAGAGYVSYRWSNGSKAQQITVGQPGEYSVIVQTADACVDTSASVAVSTYPDIAAPVIQQRYDTLFSPQAAAYEWFLNGIAIPNSNQRWIQIQTKGTYTVKVTMAYGCMKISMPYVVTSLGVEDGVEIATTVSIYPDPNSGHFTVEMQELSAGSVITLVVISGLGLEMHRSTYWSRSSIMRKSIALPDAPPGMYFLQIRTGIQQIVRKLVIQ
jgi:von Willebrand factor type A domain-containing protein/PKD domain-containing protein